MSSKKAVLFDFDGTIADTLSVCIDIANENAQSYGYRQIQKEEIETLKGYTPFQLLKEFKVPLYKVPFLIRKFQLELFDSMDQIKAFPGMKELITTLKEQGYILGIITSNSEANVKKFLKGNEITSFDFIHNEKNIFGKAQTIKHVLERHHFKRGEVMYVGDEVRDIDACRKSGIEIISVTWGFNTKTILEAHHPDFIISTPKELLSIVKQ